VRSSISSSDALGRFERAKDWVPIWLIATTVAAITLLCAEVIARQAGFSPSVRDDPRTWSAARARAREDRVVFAGTSRVQAAIDPRAWADAWNGEFPVQLAMAGDTPLPILEDLATDPDFHGLVIVEILPRILFGSREGRGLESRRYLSSWRRTRSSLSRRVEAQLRIGVAEHLAALSLPPAQLLSRLRRPGGPRVPYFSMDGMRFLRLDFSRADLDRRRATILEQISAADAPVGDDDRDQVVARLVAAEDALAQRGAQLVWLQMPRSGQIEGVEEAQFPSARFWEPLLAQSRALALSATQIGPLSDFVCPDGSHIDVRDAPRFTRALAEVLNDRLQLP
jgi:hypothetical protein